MKKAINLGKKFKIINIRPFKVQPKKNNFHRINFPLKYNKTENNLNKFQMSSIILILKVKRDKSNKGMFKVFWLLIPEDREKIKKCSISNNKIKITIKVKSKEGQVILTLIFNKRGHKRT